ncbi:hypothetical protein [Mucilaginibacter flavus]|uniref:hypothetical protein n=1 Tax=Mucilaginibacter flavus TaxID=931504 RepID=UPI0025B4C9D1|nr:hypothetical protein [Mucilaginibacter flavus]MDN3584430.1 hypothetical protein [Mucilaginibacter flavus]
MQAQKPQTHQIILCSLYLAVLLLGALIFIAPAAVFPDPSWGFQVLQKMQAGGAFNIAVKPDQEDLSKNYSEFLSWWSPGQYLIPFFLKSVFGVNTGQASALTTTICGLLGISGCYAFFKKAGFTPALATVSVLVIAFQQAFIVPYVFYNGGEVLLFGFAGWFLYGCINMDKAGWKLALFLLFSGWIGFFCKSSFLWVYGAACLYLWICLSQNQLKAIHWIKNGAWIATPAILSFVLIELLYLSKGANPAGQTAGFLLSWQSLAFPLASPLLAGFSVDDIFHGLVFQSNAAIVGSTRAAIILLLSAVVSVFLVVNVIRHVPHKKYSFLVLVFYAVSVLFFGYSFLHQASISYEARHFRVIGLLITPGIVYLVSLWRQPFRIMFGVICLLIAGLSLRYFIPSYIHNKNISAKGTSGLAQMFIDQHSLDEIISLDKKNTGALFVFISPDLGLEINHNRYITLDPIGADVKIDFDDYVHYGHAGPVFILLPASYMGPKSNIIRKCFPGYKGFHMDMLSDGYVLYSAK